MSKIEERLREILERLPDEQAQQLLEYAEFLLTKHGDENLPSEPLAIARPEAESVVVAIKRLRATYPMLESAKLLNETYDLMNQHIMKGRSAVEVIDELEMLFRRHYERLAGDRD
ncbi:MAG: Crp/Fnr family transcriptional regulator [Actinomycetota bacterium]